MDNNIFTSLGRLRDAELVADMKTLIARERGVSAEVIAHLAELDTRDVHLREGYASLYVYCRDALGLSEWEAYNRIDVARTARRFPVILEMLAEGSVHLTTVRLLSPHLTPANHREVLDSARGRRKTEVEEIRANLFWNKFAWARSAQCSDETASPKHGGGALRPRRYKTRATEPATAA